MNTASKIRCQWLAVLFFCAFSAPSAEVSYIPARDYATTIISDINNAKRSGTFRRRACRCLSKTPVPHCMPRPS